MPFTTINKSTDHFTTTLWTGDNTTPKTFTTGTFKPDFLWGKNRSQAYNHQVYDTSRGAGNTKELEPSTTGAEGASNPETYGYVSAFTSTGFTATKGTDSAGYDYWNENPDNYVAWSWKANGGTTSSNSDGSITSTVQANTTAGFSIVTWTGTGSNATIGTGIGNNAKIKFIIAKQLNETRGWAVYHTSIGAGNYLYLNATDASASGSPMWQSTAPANGVISIGTYSEVNKSGASYIAYVFAEVTGYSRFGFYDANNNADGNFLYTGFKPSLIILKNINASENWLMFDNRRIGHNGSSTSGNFHLHPNTSSVENTNTGHYVDMLSNGFKIRVVTNSINVNQNFIYMAWGQSLVGSNNVPCTAR